jgi:hypothetical protein
MEKQTRYSTVCWAFNRELWAQSIRSWVEAFGVKDVAELLQVSTGAVSGWMHMPRKIDYPWPSMMSFMRVVNELGLDPSDFFMEVDNG